MKILHLVASLATGGAEKQLHLLCNATRRRIEHHVLSLLPGDRWVEPLRESGAVVIQLALPSLRTPLTLLRIREALAQIRPDLVQCWLPSMNIAGALAAHMVAGLSCPVVASVRNVDHWKSWSYRLLERCVAPLWDGVICNSHSGAEITRRAGIPTSRICVVPNGLPHRPIADENEIAKARKDLALSADHFVVCTASRLTGQKRVDQFLRVAASLSSMVPHTRFLVAGDGPLRAELESLAASLGVQSNLRFLGSLRDVRPVLAASNAFVLCSEREGMSNALLEAMQAGTVPIATDAGDNRRIISDHVSGRILPPDQMPGALGELACARSLLGRMRERAAEAATAYTVPAMADATVEIYRKVMLGKCLEPIYEKT
ncbi:MAG: glycosyltransferase [Acidobacteriia bacterium]|nr:glycosyltransferase [Terriglobia bacterium]